jgi:hypothetical protein
MRLVSERTCPAAVPPRYENTVEVDPRVYANVDKFRRIDSNGKKKAPGDHLFGEWVAGGG